MTSGPFSSQLDRRNTANQGNQDYFNNLVMKNKTRQNQIKREFSGNRPEPETPKQMYGAEFASNPKNTFHIKRASGIDGCEIEDDEQNTESGIDRLNNQSFRGSQTHIKHLYNSVPTKKGEEPSAVRKGAGGIKNTEQINSIIAQESMYVKAAPYSHHGMI